MTKGKYIFTKRTSSKQIVHYSFEYKKHIIIYGMKFPLKEGANGTYYAKLAAEKIKSLEKSGELKKYSERYIKIMEARVKHKPLIIGAIAAMGAIVVGVVIAGTVSYFNYYTGSKAILNSNSLTFKNDGFTLHRNAVFDFKVNDFYTKYDYSVPESIKQVTVNGNVLKDDQYSYAVGKLTIPAQFVTGKIVVTAEAKPVDFAQDPWSKIIEYSNKGLYEMSIRYGKSVVGEEHTLKLGDKDVKVRVIGEGHDQLVEDGEPSNKAASLTFEFETAVETAAYADIESVCNSIYEELPSDIKEVTKPVYKRYYNGAEVLSNAYTLFPLSYREINGYETIDDAYGSEESCYEYYLDLDILSLKEKRKKDKGYWLRDVDNSDPNSKAVSINSSSGDTSEREKINPLGIAPAFAIGETDSFITDSWENIAYYANYGLDALQDRYGRSSFVGLEKEIKFNDDTTHKVRVIGENHDLLKDSNNKVAALTFEFITPISTDYKKYDDSATTTSYSTSSLRTFLEDQVSYNFPKVLADNIPYVSKKTVEHKEIEELSSYPIPSCETTEERLFPLSLREIGDVFFGTAEPYSLEEEAYDFYKIGRNYTEKALDLNNKKRKKNDNNYWLRSHHCLSEKAHIVYETGETYGVIGDQVSTIVRDLDNVFYCYPAFSLGYSSQPTTFYNDTWENVCYHAGLGLDHLKEYYNVDSFVGYQREITLKQGEASNTYNVRVIGENEDTDINGEQTTLTFEFKQGITPFEGSRYFADEETFPYYSDSVVRSYCNEDVFMSLPESIQDSIKTVKKKTVILKDVGSFDIEETEDKVFVLSRNEICDAYNEIEVGKEFYQRENPTYSYYQSATDMVRHKTANDPYGNYWLRSPYLEYGGVGYKNAYCINSVGVLQPLPATRFLSVAPAFAI